MNTATKISLQYIGLGILCLFCLFVFVKLLGWSLGAGPTAAVCVCILISAVKEAYKKGYEEGGDNKGEKTSC